MSKILEDHSCYEILPVSFKVLIFDHKLLVKKALAALLQHSVPSAPLWDSLNHQFIGMLTVTDFIQLVLYYFDRLMPIDQALEEIDKLTISGLRGIPRQVLIAKTLKKTFCTVFR